MKTRRENLRDGKKDDRDQPDIKALVGARTGNKGERRHVQLIVLSGMTPLSTHGPFPDFCSPRRPVTPKRAKAEASANGANGMRCEPHLCSMAGKAAKGSGRAQRELLR